MRQAADVFLFSSSMIAFMIISSSTTISSSSSTTTTTTTTIIIHMIISITSIKLWFSLASGEVRQALELSSNTSN